MTTWFFFNLVVILYQIKILNWSNTKRQKKAIKGFQVALDQIQKALRLSREYYSFRFV